MAKPGYVTSTSDEDKLEELISQRRNKRNDVNKTIAKLQEDINKIEEQKAQPDYEAQPEDEIQLQAYKASIHMMELSLADDPRQYKIAKLERKLEALQDKQALPGYRENDEDTASRAELTQMLADVMAGKAVEIEEDENKENNITVNFTTRFDFLSDEQNDRLAVFMKEMEEKAKKAFKQDAGPLIQQILGVLPQTMFFLLPIFALLLKIFYLFSKRFYMEHLTVALHSHSFMFVVLIMLAMLTTLDENLGVNYGTLKEIIEGAAVLLVIWVPCYLFMMQKKVYKQGYFMTLIKFGLVGFSYIFLLSITTFVAFFWGLAKL
jgi:hypothetical protein